MNKTLHFFLQYFIQYPYDTENKDADEDSANCDAIIT